MSATRTSQSGTGSEPTFSSPMVNFPCVCLFEFANASSFLIGSLCATLTAKLTLPFVYSCPGWGREVSGERPSDTQAMTLT